VGAAAHVPLGCPPQAARLKLRAYERRNTMAGKFVLKKGTTGKFRFNLLSSNGKVIATSQAYETKRAALAGIESVRKNAAAAKLEDATAK
jgi:uncharacterized protein YegP (UPF0339 family)